MSLKPGLVQPVPEETARIARAAFPKGNLYLRMRDELGPIYHDETFVPLFSQRGQPAEVPWRLALMTVMQFVEELTDRQAADAIRGRIDWKYALGLELSDPGFDFSVLCEFRERLLAGQVERVLLDALLEVFKQKGWLKAGGQQRSDSTHVIAAIRTLNRLECVGETLRATLNSLAVVAPVWLRQLVTADWFDRYALPFVNDRLPKRDEERQALAEAIGRDGFQLLDAVYRADAPAWLREVPAIGVLRQVWMQQYAVFEETVRSRDPKDLPPCAKRIHSPYDSDARYSSKRTTTWTGYKVHLTETCDEGAYLITDVQTTPGTTTDREVTATIHDTLAQRKLLPREHLLDAGYLDADLLVESAQAYGMNLVGPVPEDASWQKGSGQGYDVSTFVIDWEKQQAICPNGKVSREWKPTHSAYGLPVIHLEFDKQDCLACPTRQFCTRAKAGAREMTIRPQAQHEALQRARQRQTTAAFQEQYAKRAGIEGTHSQGTSAFGLRSARYRGLPKTHLQHLATAAAINLVRFFAWVSGTPHAQTRHSAFAQLAALAI